VRLRPWRTWTAGTRGARRRISRRVSWDGVKKRRWRLACESFVRGARQACHAGRRVAAPSTRSPSAPAPPPTGDRLLATAAALVSAAVAALFAMRPFGETTRGLWWLRTRARPARGENAEIEDR
jgi:hypothetical protein